MFDYRALTSVYLNAIPDELKAKPNWCNWTPTERANGRIGKRPLNPLTLAPARVTDPYSWGTFQEAVANLNPVTGLGFVTDDRYRIFAGDIDDCRDNETEKISAEALEIIQALDTYTEISPSGNGIRFIGFGDLDKNYQKPGVLELYHDRHFVTITGNVLWCQYMVNECTPALQEIVSRLFPEVNPQGGETRRDYPAAPSDKIVIAKLCADPRRAALWNGDIKAYWNGTRFDHSAADLALVNHIIYWSNYEEPEAISRVFRCSGLYRPKWDEVHTADGLTYGQITIRKALNSRCAIW